MTRDLFAVIALAAGLLTAYAQHRGVDVHVPIPGVVINDPAPGVVVPGSGLRVLFVRPGDPSDSLPGGHDHIPSLGVVRDWIKANSASFRSWTPDTDLSVAPADYRLMMSLPRMESRWLVVANGPKVRFSGPWPATGDEALKVLESCK